MAKHEIEMNLLRSTKGTHVYHNDDEGTPIKTVYIVRGELPTKPPEVINIRIDYDS